MLRARQMFGKYRITRRIDRGGFADVYRARDTVEGVEVAIKLPHEHMVNKDTLELFRREVRLTARLDHPHILPIKTAGFIDRQFVIVYPLGRMNLAERLRRRLTLRKGLDFGEQLLAALAYAHERRIVHCDVKPENVILFDADRLRLTDFGIAKVAFHSLRAAGTGTVGYVAPEQALGRPSVRSDVFSAGLVLYRMLSGVLPDWPYAWPASGYERLKGRIHPDMIALLKRSLAYDARQRFSSAGPMLAAFRRLKTRTLAHAARRTTRSRRGRRRTTSDWKTVRRRQYLREYGTRTEARHTCQQCQGPVAEAMRFCPWCRLKRDVHRGETRFPGRCPRCKRGVKSDWRFCAWCYGGAIGPGSSREYSDLRYEARCSNARCPRKDLMPFMSYCPWCNTKVRKTWPIPGLPDRCHRCRWGVVREFWNACPWCGAVLHSRRSA